ncbi:MAG: glycosyltransferase [Rhabdochlamydiaceae bacterium]|nr:glycosyltransferase [Candidatus Amphrikana amoebophyrae]
MIVKDESPVIERCLNSVKDHIDYWVIFDTGSSDNTCEIIERVLKGIPGELHHSKWVDFGYNRNEALEISKQKSDYSLFIDADEVMLSDLNLKEAQLNSDAYLIDVILPKGMCQRKFLVKNKSALKWVNPIHEILSIKSNSTQTYVREVQYDSRHMDGFRAKNQMSTYKSDAQILEKELLHNPSSIEILYHLAQTLEASKQYDQAIQRYKQLSENKAPFLKFFSFYRIANILVEKDDSFDQIIKYISQSFKYGPTQVEPLYLLSCYAFNKNHYLLALLVSRYALEIPEDKSLIYMEEDVRNYALLEVLKKSAKEIGLSDVAKDISHHLESKSDQSIQMLLSKVK